ncbi:MAG: amidohydrolase [Bacilli bacterium]
MKTLLKNCRILSMKDGEDIYISNIVIIDSKIKYIGEHYENYQPFDKVIDINFNLIMPGFKNAHAHAPMSFARSLTDGERLHDWLNNTIFPLEEHLEKLDSEIFSKVSFLEYLQSGIVASSEMYYNPDYIAKAAKQMNFKTHLILGGVKNFLDAEAIIDELKKYPSDLITYNLGLHAEYSYDEPFFLENVKLFNKYHSPLFIHASETSDEVEGCKKRHNGLSPIQYLDQLGYFNYGGTIYHGNYLSDDDIDILLKRKISVVTCPGSNSKLASGICPVRKLLDSGVNVAIGTDGPASNDGLDMFYEMKLVASYQKILYKDASIIKPKEILKMATVNGALAMGLVDSLYIDVNQNADLIEIDLTNPSNQPINDIVSNIVFSGNKMMIKMTMINGEVLYRDFQFNKNYDVSSIYKSANERKDSLLKYLNKK